MRSVPTVGKLPPGPPCAVSLFGDLWHFATVDWRLISTECYEMSLRPLAEMVFVAALPGPLLAVVDCLRPYRDPPRPPICAPDRPSWVLAPPGPLGIWTCTARDGKRAYLAYRTWDRFARSCWQVSCRVVSTSYIERLNTTFEERLIVLARRTWQLARTRATLEASPYLFEAVYNFIKARKVCNWRSARSSIQAGTVAG